ncbi:MAG TPA: prepilin-type N-terminal cleavage/methylation domain-containing protein [Nitrospiria bacterium]|jgi:Tfp pilus assembly protein FimT
MKNQEGFTAIEIMVVGAILGVLTIMAFGLMNSQMDHYRLNTAARELISSMRKDAQIAVTRNANRTITFTDNAAPVSDRYNLGDGTPVPLPVGIFFGVSGGGAPGNGTIDVGGVAIGGAPFTFGGNDVTFQTNRTPDEAGEVYLTNARGENIAISVNLVGRVRCWRWGGAAWLNC